MNSKKQTLQLVALVLISSAAGSFMTLGITQVMAQGMFNAGQNPTLPYQGRLESNGSPVTANIQMRFQFYDASNIPVGSVQGHSVSVKNGYFSQDLDVPAGLKNADRVGVGVSIQKPGSPDFVQLQGRQWLYPALRAYKADAGNDTFNVPKKLLFTDGTGEAAEINRALLNGATSLNLVSGATGADNNIGLTVGGDNVVDVRRSVINLKTNVDVSSALNVTDNASFKSDVVIEGGNLTVTKNSTTLGGKITANKLDLDLDNKGKAYPDSINLSDDENEVTNLIFVSEGFCFLSRVSGKFDDNNTTEHECHVFNDSGQWKLRTRANDDVELECEAHCIRLNPNF